MKGKFRNITVNPLLRRDYSLLLKKVDLNTGYKNCGDE
jgi:hypothetical protein